MKKILIPVYFIWQWLVAVPILLSLTVFTAIFTVCTVRWRNSEFVHKEQQLWSRCFFWLFGLGHEVEGTENLEKGQSYVFVANHVSLFDVWLIYGWLPVVFKWIMKQELRKVPFVGTGCYAAGHIFIDRRHPRSAMESLERAKKILTDGVSLVVFPEGTRSKNGEVQSFKRGAFQVAFELGLPVVPISLSGMYNVVPKGSLFVHPFTRTKMKVGKPIDLKDYMHADPEDSAAVKKEQLEVMELLRNQIVAGKEF